MNEGPCEFEFRTFDFLSFQAERYGRYIALDGKVGHFRSVEVVNESFGRDLPGRVEL